MEKLAQLLVILIERWHLRSYFIVLPAARPLPGTEIRFTRAMPLAVGGEVGRGGVCLCVGPCLSPFEAAMTTTTMMMMRV